MRTAATDLLVVGTGLAGLACALAWPGRALVLTKTAAPASGSSWWAKGGIAAAIGAGDTPEQHALDTLAVACGLALPGVVDLVTAAAPALVRRLDAAGVPFDRTEEGALALGREAAHRCHRVAHAEGDATGRAVVTTLLHLLRRQPRLELRSSAMVLDLVQDRAGRVRGALVYDDDEGLLLVETPRVVLACGGIGALWPRTTNPPEATGDGLALAARAGAVLADLEFVQFHPTALDVPTCDGSGLPLLTEALRGAGARLVDGEGRPLGAGLELAPRDRVARTVHARSQAGLATGIDLRPAIAARGEAAFPSALAACRSAGLEPLGAPVPIVPAAHFHMGGVFTDDRGRTSLKGLWACGEVATTGLHGANRLASNALLEALVMGERVARDAGLVEAGQGTCALPAPGVGDPLLAAKAWTAVRGVASAALGIVRDGDALRRAELGLARTAMELERASIAKVADLPAGRLGLVRSWSEARNLTLVARLLAQTARHREESRGAHHRRDFPDLDPAWQRRQTLTLDDLGPSGRADEVRTHDAA